MNIGTMSTTTPVIKPGRELVAGDVFRDSKFRHKVVVTSAAPIVTKIGVVVPILRHGETWLDLDEDVTVLGTATSEKHADQFRDQLRDRT